MSIFSYMRISTKVEDEKQSFKRQANGIKKYLDEKGINPKMVISFKDDASGKNFDREEWKDLEKELKAGDTIIFKDVSRFTRQAKAGLKKYMELIGKDINLVFIDNMTISSDYIKNLLDVASKQDTILESALESTIKLLLLVELDRAEKERLILIDRIKQGIQASSKTQGRKAGQLDKMNDKLKEDIKLFINDRSIKQVDLMKKHNISRNTLKKYVELIKEEGSI